jgi:hypothetical protein
LWPNRLSKIQRCLKQATPLACNTFPGKQELVKKVIGVYLILPMKVLKHIHLDVGQVGTPNAQGRITNPGLERNLVLGRSDVMIGRSGFNKRYQQMEIENFLPAQEWVPVTLTLSEKKYSFCWIICFTLIQKNLTDMKNSKN